MTKKKCLNCAKFLSCTDTKKVKIVNHVCDSWRRIKVEEHHPAHAELVPRGEKDWGALAVGPDGEIPDDAPDNFVADAMARAYDPETNTVRDLRVDDASLPLAKNFFDFCLNVIGTGQPPFARQMYMAYMLLSEYCPRCTKPKWTESITNIEVDMDTRDLRKKVAFLEHGVCPYCYATRGELIASGELTDRTELIMIAGQRSGKSTICVMLIAYITHVLLKSPKLSALYNGIQDYTPLSCTVVATTAAQANKTLWSPFRKLVTNSTWYKELFQILDNGKEGHGKELYAFNPGTGLYLRFFHKNLDLSSSGPAKRTLRGDSRYCAATDELGLFPFNPNSDEDDEDERERANADEVHQSLANSLTTVQAAVIAARKKGINHLPQAINFNISSPFSWMDKICRLYLENIDNPNAVVVKQPTWEISPMYTRDHPIIVAAYRRNEKKAERDYGANPPKIGSDFYQRDSVQKCFQIEPWYGVVYEADAEHTVAKAVRRYKSAKHPPAVLALDAGSTDNAFSLALSYRADGDVVVPVLLEVVPQPGKVIHFPTMYKNIILPICKECNVKVLLADRWNSLQILQQAKDDVKDLKAVQYSVKMGDFTNVVGLVESGCLIFPRLELDPARTELITDYKRELLNHPADHLYLQCLTVQEIGGTVTKGSSPSGIRYTDDIHRAMVLAVTGVLNERVSTYLSKFKIVEREASDNPGILVMGNSSFNYSQMLSGGMGRRNW